MATLFIGFECFPCTVHWTIWLKYRGSAVNIPRNAIMTMKQFVSWKNTSFVSNNVPLICVQALILCKWVNIPKQYLYHLSSIWCDWSCKWQELCCIEWYPHWHNGLHRPSHLHGHGVSADVGRIRVGEQSVRQYKHHRSAGLFASSCGFNQHEMSDTRKGLSTINYTLGVMTLLKPAHMVIPWKN